MSGQAKVDAESGEASSSGELNYRPPRDEPSGEASMTKRQRKSLLLEQSVDLLKSTKAKNETWSESENRLLFEYQRQFGNCWSLIAKKLARYGFPWQLRSDNSVKNHFYSTFRKSVRHINKFIGQYCRRFKIKTISNRALLNILSASEEVRLRKDEVSSETICRCEAIKLRLVKYSSETATFDKGHLIDLINEIAAVNRDIKLQKNQQTETIITTISRKTALLNGPDSEVEPKKPVPAPEPVSPFILLSPLNFQHFGQPQIISVSAPGQLAVGPPQPTLMPLGQPLGLSYPQVLYCMMAPSTSSQL